MVAGRHTCEGAVMVEANIDEKTVRSFGDEWSAYDQSQLSDEESARRFDEYFSIFPWDNLPDGAVGADIGCGSGRWALRVAPRVGVLHCIDASGQALAVARRNLASQANCRFHQASVDAISLPPGSMDFCYSIGVLHHVPDTLAGIKACVALLKPGAPLLIYLYYALENRPWWFRAIWKSTDLLRRGIARLPFWPKRMVTEAIALVVYWPLARLCALIEYLGGDPAGLPLSYHRHDGFYTMRTDAHDRFGTRLEHRFSRAQIEAMMRKADLDDIRFAETEPFWCAVGRRSRAVGRHHATEIGTDLARVADTRGGAEPSARRRVAVASTQASPALRTTARFTRASMLTASVLLILGVMLTAPAHGEPKTDLHHAPNRNFDVRGNFLPGKVGFNVADVSTARQLNSLPNGVKALVWVGQCRGVDATFLKTVQPFIGSSKLLAFFLMDDPDPTGRYYPLCTADNLRAESDWIHTNVPGAKTFIVLMKLSSSKAPSFINTYNPANSHVDLFGIDPYPCRTELKDCDYDMIDRYVVAAEAWGIPRSIMVPVYQTFGGGGWMDDSGGRYIMPSVSQMRQILDRWGTLTPTPVFDFAYSWGSQRADEALEGSPDLQAVFALHNAASGP
jgi:SAM-dependent methyltransferase